MDVVKQVVEYWVKLIVQQPVYSSRMSTVNENMGVNDEHEPTEAQELVLDIFKIEQRERDESRMTPGLLRERIREHADRDESRQTVNYALQRLTDAGWVRKIASGLYEYNTDPRNTDT